MPYCVLGNQPVVFLCLLDDGGKVTTSAILHEDVEDASFSVNVSVVIAYNVFMIKVLKNVSVCTFTGRILQVSTIRYISW